MMMDNGLLGEHGGSISCRYIHWKGLEWSGMDWQWFKMKFVKNWVFLCSNVPLNVRTLEPADEWLTMNVQTFILKVRTWAPSGVLAWKCWTFKRSFWMFEHWTLRTFGLRCWNVRTCISNVRMFKTSDVGRLDVKRSNVPLIRSNVWLRWCIGLESES